MDNIVPFTEDKSAHLYYIALTQLKEVWGDTWPFLELAVEMAGQQRQEDVLYSIISGSQHLFISKNGFGEITGAVTVTILDYPRKRVASTVYMGGTLFEVRELMEHLKDWCRAMGAASFRVHGRKGWAKVLPEFGFRHRSIEMEVEL